MNELQVKTTEISPAKIKFNHKEIEKELENSLSKYQGLTFTEETTTELRSTLAELRKGKRAVDRYRIDTKKELNEPVIEFENKCKALNEKFDSVINPLVKQQAEFEETRRAEKLAKIKIVKTELIEEFELEDSFAEQVTIDDSYLTKSMSMTTVTDSIKFEIENLKMRQDKEKQDKQMIETTVRLVNAENDLSFSAEAYVRLLEFDDVESVESQINNDVEKALEKKAAEEREKERIKQEKEEAELKAQAKADQEKIEAKEREVKEKMEQAKKSLEESVPVLKIKDDPFDDIEEIPFTDMADPFADEPVINIKVYQVSGTPEQLAQLEYYLSDIGVEWADIDE